MTQVGDVVKGVAAESTRRAALVFTRDPGEADLSVAAVGYQLP